MGRRCCWFSGEMWQVNSDCIQRILSLKTLGAFWKLLVLRALFWQQFLDQKCVYSSEGAFPIGYMNCSAWWCQLLKEWWTTRQRQTNFSLVCKIGNWQKVSRALHYLNPRRWQRQTEKGIKWIKIRRECLSLVSHFAETKGPYISYSVPLCKPSAQGINSNYTHLCFHWAFVVLLHQLPNSCK